MAVAGGNPESGATGNGAYHGNGIGHAGPVPHPPGGADVIETVEGVERDPVQDAGS